MPKIKKKLLEKLIQIHNKNVKIVGDLNDGYLDDLETFSKQIENSPDYSLKFIRYEEQKTYYVELLVLKNRVFLLAFKEEYSTDDIINLYQSLKEFSKDENEGLKMIESFIKGDIDSISEEDCVEIDVEKYINFL